jgi:hypothetical protein
MLCRKIADFLNIKRRRNIVISCVFTFCIIAKRLFGFVGEYQKNLVAVVAVNDEIFRSYCGKFEYRFILTVAIADPVELFTVKTQTGSLTKSIIS